MDQDDVEVEDRYYSNKEYNKLSLDQKAKLKALREAHGRKSKKKQKKDPTTSTMKKMTKQISALTAAIASSMEIAADSQDDNGSGTDAATSGNRNNTALTRQGAGNGKG